jgi:dTDP-glucose 4,6-dehydratase
MPRVLITGGAGFIGSNFVRQLLQYYPEYQVFVLDALTYAGNLSNFSKTLRRNARFFFWQGNVRDREVAEKLVSQVDQIVHFAAETHVDNSIYNTDDFIDTDVKGTQILLDAARKYPVERFVHISTSEVYGTALMEPMDESHPLNPRSPYASAKAGADRLVYSYYCTFDLPVVIMRPFNNYGPYQHVEKVIPCFITQSLQDLRLPVHGTGESSRDWVYVEDDGKAIARALTVDLKNVKGEAINIGTGVATSVITIAKMILDKLQKPQSLIERVYERPGQVKTHVADASKAEKLLGWKVETDFETGLERTIEWYIRNEQWWRSLRRKH